MARAIDKIAKCLTELCPATAEKFKEAFTPTSVFSDGQLKEVNTFLRTQLGLMEQSTIKERECLIDHIPVNIWMRDFKQHVAPTIVERGLLAWKN